MPNLLSEDCSISEDIKKMSSARCEDLKASWYPGEKMPPAWNDSRLPEMMYAQNPPMWCDQTQDLSGRTTDMDTAPLPSDELLGLPSLIPPDYDISVQNSGHPSPDEFFESDQEINTILGDEFNLFDNSSDSWTDNVILPSNNDITNPPLLPEDGVCLPPLDSENSFVLLDAIMKQPVKKQSGDLSIFESEEPRIKGCEVGFNDAKPFVVKEENFPLMGVAEEVEVTTEEESLTSSPESHYRFRREDIVNIKKEEQCMDEEIVKIKEEEKYVDEEIVKIKKEEKLPPFSLRTYSTANLDWPPREEVPPKPSRARFGGGLKLNIKAATTNSNPCCTTTSSNACYTNTPSTCGAGPTLDITSAELDTPDVLDPLFNPKKFDLIAFIEQNLGDDNNNNYSSNNNNSNNNNNCNRNIKKANDNKSINSINNCKNVNSNVNVNININTNRNAVSPSNENKEANGVQERRGKSGLTLTELKSSQEPRGRKRREWRKTSVAESTPSPSSTSSTPPLRLPVRPTRKSAEKFRQRLEEGLLAEAVVSDEEEEEEEPLRKRRRTVSSSSSRRRHNSDSDMSSICDDAMKYRERRDRNNLSSKLSRQKRKNTQQMKQQELKELESKNVRLRRELEVLEKTLNRMESAWKQFLDKV